MLRILPARRVPVAAAAMCVCSAAFAAASLPVVCCRAQTAAALPAGVSLLGNAPLEQLQLAGARELGTRQMVPVAPGQPFKSALRVETLRRPANDWDFELIASIDEPVKKMRCAAGDVLRPRHQGTGGNRPGARIAGFSNHRPGVGEIGVAGGGDSPNVETL